MAIITHYSLLNFTSIIKAYYAYEDEKIILTIVGVRCYFKKPLLVSTVNKVSKTMRLLIAPLFILDWSLGRLP